MPPNLRFTVKCFMLSANPRFFKVLLIFFLVLINQNLTYAQLSFNVEKKMAASYDFMTLNIMEKMYQLSLHKIDAGILSEKEARCIAISTTDLMGNAAAQKFNRITEKSLQGITPSLNDEKFIEEISQRYLPFMNLIAEECSQLRERQRKDNHFEDNS